MRNNIFPPSKMMDTPKDTFVENWHPSIYFGSFMFGDVVWYLLALLLHRLS
jgi:hypothetical protein